MVPGRILVRQRFYSDVDEEDDISAEVSAEASDVVIPILIQTIKLELNVLSAKRKRII